MCHYTVGVNALHQALEMFSAATVPPTNAEHAVLGLLGCTINQVALFMYTNCSAEQSLLDTGF